MAGGGSGFGAFAGGLWQGATSAMQLANAYRQYQQTSRALDWGDATAKAYLGDPGTDPNQTAAPAAAIATPGTPDQTQPASTDQATQQAGQLDRERQGYDTTDQGPVSSATTEAAPKTPAKTAAKQPQTKAMDYVDAWKRGFTEAGGTITPQSYATGDTNKLATPPVQQPAQAAPGVSERQAYTYRPPVIATPQTAPQQGVPVAPRSVAPSTMPTFDVPMTQSGALSSAQGTTQGTAAQTGPAPQPGAVSMPPLTTGAPAPGLAPGQPGAPAAVAPAQPTPVSQAQPPQQPQQPSAVSRILSAVNPVGSAQAAEVPPPPAGYGGPPAAQPGTAAAPAAPAPAPAAPAPAAAQPIAPAMTNAATGGTTPPPHAPVTTAQPTTRAATALPPSPAPVTATGPGTKVAPSQKAPSQQSEPTPPVAPQISHAAFDRLSKSDQDYLIKVAREDGQGQVSPYQLAATWQREGGAQHAGVPNGSAGEIGPFQIKPGTWDTLDPGRTIDITTFPGAARVAARYYADSAQHGYKAQSPGQDAAYMAGAGGARNWANLTPAQQASVRQMYPGFDPAKDSWANAGNAASDQQIHNAVVDAGHRFGPNGALQAIVETGANGVGMSQLWRNAEAAGIRYMLSSGHPEAVPAMHEWYAQMSHQGALSNMYAGYQALRGGSPQTAAQFFARAHAFFPDGSFGRFGVDKDNKVFGELLDEGTHQSMGPGFQITPEAVQEEMMRIVHPANFIEKLVDMRAKTAEIQLHQAQTSYYLQRPDLQREAISERGREADERSADRQAALGATSQRAADAQQRHEDQVQQQLDSDRRPIDASVTKRYDETGTEAVSRSKGETDDQYGARSQVEAVLRYPTRAGGAGMATKSAENLAAGIVQGKQKLVHGKDANGNPGYSIHDSDEKHPSEQNSKGFVDEERGQILERLPGVLRRPGAATLPPNAPGRTAAIGAGAGSPYALMQGIGTTYGGVQTIPLPQQQQQPTAVA